MNASNVRSLHIDIFIPPERRMDAYPSVKYEVPPIYMLDAIVLIYAPDCAVTVEIESSIAYMERGIYCSRHPWCCTATI